MSINTEDCYYQHEFSSQVFLQRLDWEKEKKKMLENASRRCYAVQSCRCLLTPITCIIANIVSCFCWPCWNDRIYEQCARKKHYNTGQNLGYKENLDVFCDIFRPCFPVLICHSLEYPMEDIDDSCSMWPCKQMSLEKEYFLLEPERQRMTDRDQEIERTLKRIEDENRSWEERYPDPEYRAKQRALFEEGERKRIEADRQERSRMRDAMAREERAREREQSEARTRFIEQHPEIPILEEQNRLMARQNELLEEQNFQIKALQWDITTASYSSM